MVNLICIIQARYKSTRLPGKMLQRLGNETLIARGYRLACEAFGKDNVVIAMPASDKHSPLLLEIAGIRAQHALVDGLESDVLRRFYQVAKALNASPETVIFRWTPDDPFKDIDSCIWVAKGAKRVPVELGGEAFTFAQLEKWNAEVTDPSLREHIGHLITPKPVKAPPGVCTIDTQADLDEANAFLNAQERRVA